MKRIILTQITTIALVSLAMLNGCSRGNKTNNPVQQPAPLAPVTPGQNSVSGEPQPSGPSDGQGKPGTPNQVSLTCGALSTDCNPSVGMLAIVDGINVSYCTAFLVSENLAMTAKSCLPNSAQKNSSLAGIATVIFPTVLPSQTSGQSAGITEETVAVSSVYSIGDSGYAELYLNSPVKNRAPLAVSTFGFPAHEGVSVVALTIAQEKGANSMEKFECGTAMNTLAQPMYHNAETQLAAVSGCNLPAHAQGAPVIGMDGLVHGVIMTEIATADVVAKLEAEKLLLLDKDGLPEKSQPIYSVSNLGCAEEFVASKSRLAASCEDRTEVVFPLTRSDLGAHLPTEVVTKYHKEVSKKVANLVINKKSPFVYKAISLPNPADFIQAEEMEAGDHFAIPAPRCIHRADLWVKGEKDANGKTKQNASMKEYLSVYKGSFGYSPSLEIAEKINTLKGALTGRLFFNAAEIEKNGSGVVTLKIANLKGKGEYVYSASLPLCNKQK